MSSESSATGYEGPSPDRPSETSSVENGRRRPSRNLSNLPSCVARRRAQEPDKTTRARPHVSLSTRQMLINFVPPEPLQDSEAKKAARAEREKVRKHVRELLRQVQQPSIGTRIRNVFEQKFISPQLPMSRFTAKSVLDTRDACRFFFPPLASLPVQVIDYYEDRGTRYTRPLSEIESLFHSKPDDVAVRWIHINVGAGILQSSIEDIFNYSGSAQHGKPFLEAGSQIWPYLDNLQVMAFYNRHLYEDQVKAWNFLSQVDSLQNGPTEDLLKGFSEIMAGDLEWRGGVAQQDLDFWTLAKADMPYSMFDRVLGDIDLRNRKLPQDMSVLDQSISRHPTFKDSLLMISHFRAFHRDDGFLLTFSSQPGINYNSNEFPQWIADAENVIENPYASALAYLSDTFLDSGTSRWHRKTVEWLAVFFTTEIATTPNSIRSAGGCPDIESAFRELAVQLKSEQKKTWQRGEAVKMVRQYLRSIEELRAIGGITARKLDLMGKLLKDCERIEQEYKDSGAYASQDPESEPMSDRVVWAIAQLTEADLSYKSLLEHYETALNEFFLLGTVEQNELAIVADHQNKAVMLFTIVTIIFLPLSFFTSYFGMNLQGIAEAERDEKYFWLSCGLAGFVIVAVLFLYAFRGQAAQAAKKFRNAGKLQKGSI